MNIRIATLDDIEKISALYQDFFAYNAKLQPAYYKAAAESGKYPEQTIRSDNEDIFVALEDGYIVGFIHVLEDKTPDYYCVVPHRHAVCVDLFVTSSHRKKGIGAGLINAAKKWAAKRNLDYMEYALRARKFLKEI